MSRKVIFSIIVLFFFMVLSASAVFACTLGGVTGKMAEKHQIFFGQTCDNAWWPTRHTLWVIEPENGYKYIGTKAYIWGFWTGMNEKGFGWAGAAVGTRDQDPDSTAPGKFEIGPLLLENCASVNEAIEMLRGILNDYGAFGPDLPTRNAIMGDAKGNLALVEISYQKINVETITKNGYVVRTNHFISDEMKGLDYRPDPYYCERYERGQQWFINKLWKSDPQWPWYSMRKASNRKIKVEDLFGYLSYVYLTRLDSPTSGPGTCMIMEPKTLTYWFTYGWPSGNLPTKELENRQISQNMTWGTFIPFYLPELPPGQYTTELGQLTPLGVQYLYSHFSHKQLRSPAWTRYQSEDSMAPFYKPEEDIASPDGYLPKENPFGPAGYVGTWSSREGFIPYDEECIQDCME